MEKIRCIVRKHFSYDERFKHSCSCEFIFLGDCDEIPLACRASTVIFWGNYLTDKWGEAIKDGDIIGRRCVFFDTDGDWWRLAKRTDERIFREIEKLRDVVTYVNHVSWEQVEIASPF